MMSYRSTVFARLFSSATILLSLPATAGSAAGQAKVVTIEAIRMARLAEPLVATGATSEVQDAALAHALDLYAQRRQSDDLSGLSKFVSDYPNSGWATAVWTNLGLAYLHNGYFTRALEAFARAWKSGKTATEPKARALVDRAVGEWMRLEASLGRFDSVSAIFTEIGDRPIAGSATEAVQVAREQLDLSTKDPRHLFLCGPRALASLLIDQGASPDRVKFLWTYRATPRGTSLAEIGKLADTANLQHRLILRSAGAAVPVPSIVHWKVGHFAAIVRFSNGRYEVKDPVVPTETIWMTPEAVDAEASGYFLVPGKEQLDAKWRLASNAEAGGIWGRGPTSSTQPGGVGPQQDPQANRKPPCPLCKYNIGESSVSLTLMDTPVGYVPPIGPSMKVEITYNQREDSQPAVFGFFNLSPKWTLNFLSYVIDDPTNVGASVSRYLPGGGAYYYSGYRSGSGVFSAQRNDGSVLALVSASPITYQRQLKDGSIETYAQSDGSSGYPRKIFLTQISDPQGNTAILNYDGLLRLTSITDAVGRQTTFTYGAPSPLLVTAIADPFGRKAVLSYDLSGRLVSITDVLGLISSFTYDANSLVNSLTTPYGTTNFSYTAPGTSAPPRFVQVEDPLGYHEREEWLEPAPIASSDPASSVPSGMPVTPSNSFLEYRNSFHWDKNQYVAASCTPTGGCDYGKARLRHFLHVGMTPVKSTGIESEKEPLENRVWYNYPGQTSSIATGSFDLPIAKGRVLDDGSTQLTQYSYDTTGYFNLTRVVDPVGRVTSFAYANNVDLSAISQTTAHGVQTTIAQFIYNTRHRPIFYTDATGQTTSYEYNATGQVTSIKNPLNQVLKFQYDPNHNVSSIIDDNNTTIAAYTYDAFARIATFTDSEGWSVSYDYDAADRLTKITYPDGTGRKFAYDKLDLASYRDREGRAWKYAYDANRQLVSATDPRLDQRLYAYTPGGQVLSLTDAKGYVTTWAHDIQGRVVSKLYADTTSKTYAYETTTSRLKSVFDALGQTRQFGYTRANELANIVYLAAVNPTANVTFNYDPYFSRLVSMADGSGTTQFTYHAVGTLGALKLQQRNTPLASGTVGYQYDVLGRVNERAVGMSGAETFTYDNIGRVTGHVSDLGAFEISYLGETRQIQNRRLLPVANLETTWGYLPNSGDRRLASISNAGLSAGQFSNYAFSTTPEALIGAITESSDTPTLYPTSLSQTATYNNVNALTNLSGQAFSFDSNGNLLSDGLRNYSWDAENRLVGISYPAQPGKLSTFTYDAFGRRTSIIETPPGGGGAVTTNFVWCGFTVCQARNAGNSVIRSYTTEGEFVPGSPGTAYYYGLDQIGSVRRVFETTSTAPAFSYDAYGNALQVATPPTDFGFAGMYFHAASGLYLTPHRAYDPVSGRWLSRDPLGEASSATANLYAYVDGNPVVYYDPLGLVTTVVVTYSKTLGVTYGSHAGVYTSNGSERGGPAIYDPAGYYILDNSAEGGDVTIEPSIADRDQYIEYQRHGSEYVEVYDIDTTPEQEQTIIDRALAVPRKVGAGFCANATGNAIGGVGPIPPLPGYYRPGSLAEGVGETPGVTKTTIPGLVR
jgi:RHS repeat-associated protein